MSNASYFKTLGQIEDRVTSRMTELRQAEHDVALHCPGMAADTVGSAEELYRAGLEHCGVSKRETAGLDARTLRILLKNLPRSGAGGSVRASSASMAYDSAGGSGVLDTILKGIKPPRNGSHRNDFLR
jgi:hypothetical protein